MNKIEYRDIPGFPGYRAGSDGSIWSCHNNRHGISNNWKKLKQSIVTYGVVKYYYVSVSDGKEIKNRKSHRLIMLAFHGEPQDGEQVRHLDGDGLNNSLSNLTYGTRQENERDKVLHGTSNRGERNGMAVVDAETVRKLKSLYVRRSRKFGSSGLAKMFNLKAGTVKSIVLGYNWSHIN